MDVLVEARREYLENLYECMVPEMISSLYTLYLEAEKLCKNQNNRLIQYQKFLKEIKNWNNSIIRQHTEEIKKTCPYFDDLITAVILSTVKIMSVVRISKPTSKLSLNVPKADDFVHDCYKAAAEDIYKKPYVMAELMTDDEREDALWDRISEAILGVIKRYVPIQQILEMNIASPSSADLVIEDPEDGEDPDVQEEQPEPEAEPMGEGEGEPMPEPVQEPVGEPVPEQDVRNIPVSAPQQSSADDDVLFPDATDKNLGTQ